MGRTTLGLGYAQTISRGAEHLEVDDVLITLDLNDRGFLVFEHVKNRMQGTRMLEVDAADRVRSGHQVTIDMSLPAPKDTVVLRRVGQTTAEVRSDGPQ